MFEMQLLYIWCSAVGCRVFCCFDNVQSVSDFRHNLSLSGFFSKAVGQFFLSVHQQIRILSQGDVIVY